MVQKVYQAPMKTKNLRCYQNTKAKLKLETIKGNKHMPKTWRKNIIHFKTLTFPNICSVSVYI